MSEPSRIVVVRHGETEWSRDGRHTGRTDLELTPAGRQSAAALREPLSRLRFGLVLSSPLERARETCEIAGFGDRAEIDDDLREWDYGAYEGLTTPEIQAQRPGWSLWVDGCPGGETPGQVSDRADRLLAALQRPGGLEVLAFAHGHILRVLAARWIGMDASAGARLALSAGAICVLSHERESRVIERWNCSPTPADV